MTPIAPEIFKAYDIRGIVDKTLTESAAEAIGRGLATTAHAKGVKRFVVGRDGRLSGPRLSQALSRGLMAGGMDVIDIGVVATPMVYYATYLFETGSGVMVTGSHNPPEYNGLKMMVAGETLAAEAIQDLRRVVEKGQFTNGAGKREIEQARPIAGVGSDDGRTRQRKGDRRVDDRPGCHRPCKKREQRQPPDLRTRLHDGRRGRAQHPDQGQADADKHLPGSSRMLVKLVDEQQGDPGDRDERAPGKARRRALSEEGPGEQAARNHQQREDGRDDP